jgi:branched-chain amino acid transport system permease protein
MSEQAETTVLQPAAHPVRSSNAAILHAVIFILIGVLLLLAPLFSYPIFVMGVLVFALYANSYALLVGAGGLLSFGHAAYFGSAAYMAGFAAKYWGFTPELAILTGTASGALLGLVFGYLAIRRQGIYFAMITLALAQMVYFICLRVPFTGGEDGLQAVPRGKVFGLISIADDLTMYYFVAILFMAAILLMYRIIHSPFGEVLRAIRGNEKRVESLGYKVFQYKLTLYVLATAIAGFAGSIKVLVIQLATLTDVYWTTSGDAVLMTLLGGIGTIFGPLAGALALQSMQTYLADFGSWVTVLHGLIFIVCVMTFREGIFGYLSKLIGRPL